jgi:hypothetical protein
MNKQKLEKKKYMEKARERRERLRIREEAKKMAQRFKEEERRRIKEEAKKEMKINITEVQKEMRGLTRKIKKLEKAKTSYLKEKAFFLEALNFDCPHCRNPCVVYRKGDSYLVKRSATVSIVPEEPVVLSTPNTLPLKQSA